MYEPYGFGGKGGAAAEDEGGAFSQPYDAEDDIQDIDRRLNALQQFLSAAKAPR